MEENIQDILKDKNEDIVQFNFENNTSSPVAVNLFDTASLIPVPTSGSNQTTTYSSSNDLLPSLPPSLFAQNPNNGTFIASDLTSNILRLINTNTNTTENNFDNSDGFSQSVFSFALQPDGKIIVGGNFIGYKGQFEYRIIRLNSDGTKDLTFDNSIGFNTQIETIELQPDGKILCGGDFSTYKGVSANRIIRLNSDGTIDTSFVYGTGFGLNVYSIAIQPDGKILCVGLFTSYNGAGGNNRIIRLNSDGTKDLTFNNSIGFNNNVQVVKIQPDGKILVGGFFTLYKGVSANRIIRLNSDGTKDLTFDNSIGFNFEVRSITIQSDGKILCGGAFTTYKGVSSNKIVRLNSDGTIDTSFVYGTGFDGTIDTFALQPDGKILCGGNFSTYQGVSANRIIRLNSDGTKDLTFDSLTGFNSQVEFILLNTDGKIFVGGSFFKYRGFSTSYFIKINLDGSSASTLSVNNTLTPLNVIKYNQNNNVFYCSDNTNGYVITSDAQEIQSTIFGASATSLTYNPNNNYLYCLNGNIINVFDCATYTFVTTISLGGSSSTILSEVTPSNEIYYFDNTLNLLQKIDCLTNTIIPINLSLPNIFTSNGLPYYNGYLYVYSNSTNIIDIVDTNTDTYFNSITIPFSYTFNPYYSAINPITNQLFITDYNLNRQFAVIDLPTNTLVSVNTLGGVGGTYGVIYNQLTNSMYISGSLFSVVTFTASPFFIGGSTNYNTFVNSLNFEPIFVEEIRILTQNQNQLYNQLQFTKIDSNGNQIFFPEFPITKVDSFQSQGNIAELKLNGLVFDGRTYINQYVINPSEIVSFEIIYKQLDRFSATPTFPIFFKPKVQLKEYIKKDYNNYDVEM